MPTVMMFFSFKRSLYRNIFIAFILLVSLLYGQQARLNKLQTLADEPVERADETSTFAQENYLRVLRQSPAFGFDNLLADWVFLQFLQYFGDDQVRAYTGYDLSSSYFENIIPRDPYYMQFYLFLSGSTSLYAAQPAKTVALMNQGLTYLKPGIPEDSFIVWRYKGTDELLFLGDAEAAQASFQTAADWAAQSDAPDAQAMAAVSQRTADFLANNPISKRAQVDAWAGILGNSFDERTQQMAIEKIETLGGQVMITEDGRVTIQYPQED
jgi:hypothetical protein